MKVYLVTQADFDRLNETLELAARRRTNPKEHPGKTEDDAYRTYNLYVRRWIDEVSKDK